MFCALRRESCAVFLFPPLTITTAPFFFQATAAVSGPPGVAAALENKCFTHVGKDSNGDDNMFTVCAFIDVKQGIMNKGLTCVCFLAYVFCVLTLNCVCFFFVFCKPLNCITLLSSFLFFPLF